jgi:hypothetical protein
MHSLINGIPGFQVLTVKKWLVWIDLAGGRKNSDGPGKMQLAKAGLNEFRLILVSLLKNER